MRKMTINLIKFAFDNSFQTTDRRIGKLKSFSNKIIFVNGFNGSGKTLFSPIVSSIDGVEQFTFPYEIEWMSALLYGGEITENAYSEFIKIYLDQLVYNQMMSRSSNFRPSDLSSIFKYKNPFIYIKRLFLTGDNSVVPRIYKSKPITSLTTCHLMPFYPQLDSILGDRLLFIETIRDPLFMFQQLLILKKSVINELPEKDFTFSVFQGETRSTYLDFYSSYDLFEKINKSSPEEAVIDYLERMQNFYLELEGNLNHEFKSTLIIIPFEKFVTSPDIWIDKILDFTGSKRSKALIIEMKRQSVPRKLLTSGRNLKIYKRFGWIDSAAQCGTLEVERDMYKNKIKELIDDDNLYRRLMLLSSTYNSWVENKF
ncbi:hypothetical protein [Polynucleobacter sp. UB-Siik-W21]|uniref:hypothetical protein n=1 Tax=Polynucleobacter sp. UB-Siik-W21 TaxID=1855646 RepID=UPI001BFDED47|nr:hypothetical protein [Polynucleobacter sp. UB-Siik-W21]QWD70704.1 hypothetical protein C2756_01625 [Polynucleobacter sp. UB-Siik-W21]